MDKLKMQHVDGTTRKPLYIRLLLAIILFPLGGFAGCRIAEIIADKTDKFDYSREVVAVIIATTALLFLRYLIHLNMKKWCYAYVIWVYQTMENTETIRCPRCDSYLDKSVNDFTFKGSKVAARDDVATCKCPNLHCKLDLNDKLKFYQMPVDRRSAEALVLNKGVYEDFRFSFGKTIFFALLSTIVFFIISYGSVFYAYPFFQSLIK